MKKVLPVAVLAALHNIKPEQTVHVDRDGTGRVLVFPFYTLPDDETVHVNQNIAARLAQEQSPCVKPQP